MGFLNRRTLLAKLAETSVSLTFLRLNLYAIQHIDNNKLIVSIDDTVLDKPYIHPIEIKMILVKPRMHVKMQKFNYTGDSWYSHLYSISDVEKGQ